MRTHCKRGHPLTRENVYNPDVPGKRHCRVCRLAKQREYALKKHYGISAAQYDEMLAFQGGRCAICGEKEPGGHGRFFCVDHDHATGDVRGLLCQPCNVKLAAIEDPDFRRQAKMYLECRAALRRRDLVVSVMPSMEEMRAPRPPL